MINVITEDTKGKMLVNGEPSAQAIKLMRIRK